MTQYKKLTPHEAFSEDMFTEPRRELEELLAKHKQEKE